MKSWYNSRPANSLPPFIAAHPANIPRWHRLASLFLC
jgi:hypothetical protein